MFVFLQGNSREVVAVKVVGKKTLNKASTENLLTEIEILKTVRHPHIVQLKDFQVSSYMCFSIAGTYARIFLMSRVLCPILSIQLFNNCSSSSGI